MDWLVALAYCVGLVWIGWCFLCYFRPPIRSPHAEQHTGHSRLCWTTSLMRVNIASSSTSSLMRVSLAFSSISSMWLSPLPFLSSSTFSKLGDGSARPLEKARHKQRGHPPRKCLRGLRKNGRNENRRICIVSSLNCQRQVVAERCAHGSFMALKEESIFG